MGLASILSELARKVASVAIGMVAYLDTEEEVDLARFETGS